MEAGMLRRRGAAGEVVLTPELRTPGSGVWAVGVRLYVLRQQPTPRSTVPLSDSPLALGISEIDGWRLRYVSKPQPEDAKPAQQPREPLTKLPELLTAMGDYERAHGGEAAGAALYRLVHIRELQLANRRVYAPPVSAHPSDPKDHRLHIDYTIQPLLRQVLDTYEEDDRRASAAAPVPRAYFKFYDAFERRRGYLLIGRHVAIAAGLSDGCLRALASRLQTAELAPSGGFTPKGLETAIESVTMWNVDGEMRESVDRVEQLHISGTAGTQGQVWLAYALFVVGITVSLMSFVGHREWFLPGIATAILSGVLHSIHAVRRSAALHLIGGLLLGLSVVLTVAAFMLATLPIPAPFTLP
jgi:hypothetical protein